MKIKYNVELKEETKNFINSILSRYDVNKIEYIDFKYNKGIYFTGICKYPISKRRSNKTGEKARTHFKIICRIGKNKIFPCIHKDYVGTKSYPDKHLWEWIFDQEKINDNDEGFIFIFGHELWHFLRKTKQELGRNNQSQANKFGFKLLRLFKESKEIRK